MTLGQGIRREKLKTVARERAKESIARTREIWVEFVADQIAIPLVVEEESSRPIFIHVQHHRPLHSGGHQGVGEGLGRQGLADDIDQTAVCSLPEASAPSEVLLVRRGPPIDVVLRSVDLGLSVIDEQVQVLSHSNHVWGQGEIAPPLANEQMAIAIEDRRGATLFQRLHHLAVVPVASPRVLKAERTIGVGHHQWQQFLRQCTMEGVGSALGLFRAGHEHRVQQ